MTDGQTRAVPLQLPGMAEADARGQEQRDLAFIALGDTSGLFTESIAGVTVQPLTMRHLLMLGLMRSCFLAGVVPPEEFAVDEIVKFLRVVGAPLTARHWWPFRKIKSPAETNADLLRRLFAANANVPETLKACQQFMDDALAQMPGGSGKGGKDYYSHAAALCHFLCSNYGMSIAAALDTPLNVAGQLLRVVRQENDPKAILFNPSDRIIAQHLEKLNAEIKRAQRN